MSKLKLYLKIFITFFKVSALTFGGGYAILPLLQAEAVEKNKWLSDDDLTDIFTMSQIVPGLLYVSSSTFIGYRVGGVIGAAIATIAVLIPSAITIMTLYFLLANLFSNSIVQKVLNGVLIGVAATTAGVVISIMKKSVNTVLTVSIFIISFTLTEFFNVKAFVLIAFGLVIGALYSYIIHKRKRSENNA